jgi:hypothetical protein
MKLDNEIFRHVRPQWFNKNRLALENLPAGGISFLFLPAENFKEYNYWIYVCPENIMFSTGTAVKRLREVASNKVKPWGTITLDDSPILSAALKSVLAEKDELPSTVATHLFSIMITNFGAQHLLEMYTQKAANARVHYE